VNLKIPEYPLILHIPHSRVEIPSDCLGDYLVGRDSLAKHLAASTDHFTDELFALSDPSVTTVTFPISRLVVDPERFEDDAQEPMAARGLGVLYECGHDGQRIRGAISPERRAYYIDRWYRPHHAALELAVNRALQTSGSALIIDCHSYPDIPLAVDLDQSRPRPDGCFGTSGIHTPSWLVDAGMRFAASQGWSFGIDRPYAGSIVPMQHYGKDARVLSIMVEVNRKRYMAIEGDQAVKTSEFDATRNFLRGLISALQTEADVRRNLQENNQ
jgi:N-formylglutamate amidohydrolase